MLLRCYCGGAAAAGRLHDVRAAAMWDVVFGRITVFAAAQDVATVITVFTYLTVSIT